METKNEEKNKECCEHEHHQEKTKSDYARYYIIGGSIILSGIIISATWAYTVFKYAGLNGNISGSAKRELVAVDSGKVIPSKGVELPVVWGDLGAELVDSGTIDAAKLEALYKQRGFTDEDKKLLFGTDNGKLKITEENSGYILNLFWALGLANKNEILEKGEMADKKYGGTANFASTGGWTLSKGNVMSHYSMHQLIALTPEQQKMVDEVSKNIYRPCCNNSTHFPDCNHGMAMLGFLELMASQGVSEKDMYKYALAVNSYWFPDTYITIAEYEKTKGIDWDKVNPKEVLGADFSSASGYQKILNEVEPAASEKGSSCGV